MNIHKHNEKSLISLVNVELMCHLPYAVFSVSISIILAGLFGYFATSAKGMELAHHLFHGFHYLHLLFAGTGVVLMFRKYSKNIFACFLVGMIVPSIFCTLSDAVIPFLSGKMMSLDMHFHWCFRDHINTVLPFLGVGVINGMIMSSHKQEQDGGYLITSHFLHILISSMASILYLISFGFVHIWESVGVVFVFLLVAVLVPCTLSDVVVPLIFARSGINKNGVKSPGSQCCTQEEDRK